MNSTEWIVAPRISPDIVSQLLINRGVRSQEERKAYLEPDYWKHTYDPFLFDDMERAVDRIFFALHHKQLIGIYGDYDVDGVCASTILYETLKALGAEVVVYMNHRERDGYGLCEQPVRTFASKGVKLFITNDCGISNASEIACANELGIDVIITDHHHVPESGIIPDAYAIIHPDVRASRYPFKKISGTGSAFKLIQGLLRAQSKKIYHEWRSQCRDREGNHINWEHFEKWLLDAVAIGTVGDCMPLIDENRVFVKYGLMVLKKTRRKALAYFLNKSHPYKELSVKSISFFIAPRINAASRMGDGILGFQMMTECDQDKAIVLAQELEDKNSERQKVSDRVFREASALLSEQYAQLRNVLVGWSDSWPLGVLGLVANKLSEHFRGKPVFLITFAHGSHIAGTARSGNGFHITKALSANSKFFTRYGGHACAGGFALKEQINLDELSQCLEQYGEHEVSQLTSKRVPIEKNIAIDCEIELSQATGDVASLITQCEPFGQGNPKPLFLSKNVEFQSLDWVGSRKNHMKILGKQGESRKKLIGFSCSQWKKDIKSGIRYDIVTELEKNSWNGNDEIQCTIKDLAPAGTKEIIYTPANSL